MSKRFGRNQRRRLQADLDKLQAARTLDTHLLAHQRGTISRMEESLRKVATVLGQHFIGLEPKTLRVHDCAMPRSVQLPYMAPTTLCEMLDWDINTLQVKALECTQIRAGLDTLGHKRHVRVQTPLGEVGYAFAPDAFRSMPREDAVRFLAREFARHLLTSPKCEGVL